MHEFVSENLYFHSDVHGQKQKNGWNAVENEQCGCYVSETNQEQEE
jgi:hypothetical protein